MIYSKELLSINDFIFKYETTKHSYIGTNYKSMNQMRCTNTIKLKKKKIIY